MKIHHKDFIKAQNFVYGKFNNESGKNIKIYKDDYYIPENSYNIKYAFVFDEQEVLNGYHGNTNFNNELKKITNSVLLNFNYNKKIKWSKNHKNNIIVIITVNDSYVND